MSRLTDDEELTKKYPRKVVVKHYEELCFGEINLNDMVRYLIKAKNEILKLNKVKRIFLTLNPSRSHAPPKLSLNYSIVESDEEYVERVQLLSSIESEERKIKEQQYLKLKKELGYE